jgi:DNA-binding beta-propeller fold protein YncE
MPRVSAMALLAIGACVLGPADYLEGKKCDATHVCPDGGFAGGNLGGGSSGGGSVGGGGASAGGSGGSGGSGGGATICGPGLKLCGAACIPTAACCTTGDCTPTRTCINFACVGHPGVTATPQTLGGTFYGVAVTPRNRVMVTTPSTPQVWLGDLNGLDASVPIALNALSMAVTPDGGAVLVTHNNNTAGVATLSVLDPQTGVTRSTPFTGESLFGVAVGSRLAYVGRNVGGVYALNEQTFASMPGVFADAGSFNGLSFDEPHARLYAAATSGWVFVIDTMNNVLAGDGGWRIPGTVQQPVVSPDGTLLYLANETTGVERYDVATRTRTGLVPNSVGAFGMAMTPDQRQLWVTRSINGDVLIIDVASFSQVGSFATSGAPRRIAFDGAGTTAVIATETGKVYFVR